MPRLGIRSNLWINSGTENTPAWNLLDLISDCNVNAPWDEGDASSRQSRVKMSEPTMLGLEITGKVRVKNSELNAAYLLMMAANRDDSPIDVLVLNGQMTENGVDGFRAYMKVFNWGEDQSLGVVLYKDFTLKPCIPPGSGQVPKYARVTGGILAYFTMGTAVG